MVCQPPLAAHRHAHQRHGCGKGRAGGAAPQQPASSRPGCVSNTTHSLSPLSAPSRCPPPRPAVDSLSPSLQFLKLGQFDELYRHFPPVITHVLKVGGNGGRCIGGGGGALRPGGPGLQGAVGSWGAALHRGAPRTQTHAVRMLLVPPHSLLPCTFFPTTTEAPGALHQERPAGRPAQPRAAAPDREPYAGARAPGLPPSPAVSLFLASLAVARLGSSVGAPGLAAHLRQRLTPLASAWHPAFLPAV